MAIPLINPVNPKQLAHTSVVARDADLDGLSAVLLAWYAP